MILGTNPVLWYQPGSAQVLAYRDIRTGVALSVMERLLDSMRVAGSLGSPQRSGSPERANPITIQVCRSPLSLPASAPHHTWTVALAQPS